MMLAPAAIALLVFLLSASPAAAGDHYALVITGASGGEPYARTYDQWRLAFATSLRERLGYPDDHIAALAEKESAGVGKATRENVRRALGDMRRRLTRNDQLLVLLIGHGTLLDAEDAKFNLVGPDLSASQWADLLKGMPGNLVFVDTTGASFPFLRKIAGRGRVVLTATDSSVQQFDTVFPEFFVKAFDDPAADVDKNGRVSVWEAFIYGSAGVRQSFERRGQLPTERPLLDDTGAGIGREAQNPGNDGAVAQNTYLQPDVLRGVGDDTTLTALDKRRRDLEAQVGTLKARRDTMAPDEYEAELERLLVELARVSRLIRTKS